VPASGYYFRTVAELDAPGGPHQWLRESLFLGSAAPSDGLVTIDIWRVG
jgi:hypothetical protein